MKIKRAYRWLRSRAWLYWNLFKDKRTPWISKILIIVAIAYLVWPFDLIPDFIPFVGLLDEVIIIPFLFYIATLFIPKHVKNDYTKRRAFTKKYDDVIEGEIVD